MPPAPHEPLSPQKESHRTRLDSWKEIADYLGRAERTAKRWEHERSLPVHHVPGGGHGSVYAYAAELDEWLLSEKPKETSPSPGLTDQPESAGDSASKQLRADPSPDVVDLPAAAPTVGWSDWSWRMLAYVLAFLGIALAALYFVKLRTTNAYSSSFFHTLLSRTLSGNSRGVSDPEKQLAHDLYLRGRFEWSKRTPDSLNRALDYFTQSIVHDPGNAQAYVGLADTYNLLREYTMMPENEAFKRALAASQKAIALDDSLAEAHRSLAFDEIWGNWDFQAGEREFQRAIELNPRDPIAHLWFANAFAAPGWYSICLREIDRAQELDPSSYAILADKGLLLFHSGQLQQGLELVQQVENSDAGFLSPHRYLASMYSTLKDYPNFIIESEKTADLTNDQVLKDTTVAAKAGFRRDGERGLFHDLYLSQKRFYAQGKLPPTFLAITCVRMGKKQEALQLLRQDYERHGPQFLMIRQNADLISLKDEPEYRDLLQKIHAPLPDSTDTYSAARELLSSPNSSSPNVH
jgi:tetratricopeptide (TPR) repeat protein